MNLTSEQLFLVENYPKVNVQDCSNQLKAETDKVEQMIVELRRLGFSLKRASNKLSLWERDYLVRNYIELGPEQCGRDLGLNAQKVMLGVCRLRKMGANIGLYCHRLSDKERTIISQYIKDNAGLVSRKQMAKNFGVAVETIKQIAGSIGASFFDYHGQYPVRQFAKLLAVGRTRIKHWIREGLEVTYLHKEKKKYILIDLEKFKQFLTKRCDILVELLGSRKISPETKLLLKLDGFKPPAKSVKVIHCKKCGIGFEVPITNEYPRCPGCGRHKSKFSAVYA